MMGGAWIGLALVVGLLVLAWRRRGRGGDRTATPARRPAERRGWFVVIGAGIVLPIARDRGALRRLGHLRHPHDAGAGGDADRG